MPTIFMICTAFKPRSEIYILPFRLFPEEWTFSNFVKGWAAKDFTRYFFTTITITVLGVMGTLVSCTLVAYGFARFRSRTKNALFAVLLIVLLLPNQVTLVPTYILFARLGMVNTILPLVFPSWLAESAFSVFLLRQFILNIPQALDDAAEIDGANSFRRLLSIYVPSIKPALFSVAIMNATYFWNDYMRPLIYLGKEENYTISLGLQFFQSEFYTVIEQLIAVALIAILPMLLLFICVQRYFIEGITLSGMKG